MLQIGSHNAPAPPQITVHAVFKNISECLVRILGLDKTPVGVTGIAFAGKYSIRVAKPHRLKDFLRQFVKAESRISGLVQRVEQCRTQEANFHKIIEMARLQGGILPVVGKAQEFPGNFLQIRLCPQMIYRGHGQYGDVLMEFEPSGDLETPYVFDEKIFGGAVPKNYFPAVEKGIAESCLKGPLAGYPVVGIKATLTDGSYHPVDSSEMAFKMAAITAFKNGVMDAKPVLLEPIVNLKVDVLDKNTGDVMGDLNKRRGRILGMNPLEGGRQELVADIPLASLIGYSTDLRSMTGGSGEFSYEFSRYEQMPADAQEKVLKEAAAEKENVK